MKQKEVFKKIGGIIQELSEQYEYLETVVDNLNDLELELFVSNAHFLTDHIEILCKLNLQNKPKRPLVEKPETYQQKFFEPVVQKMNPVADLKSLRTSKPPIKPVEVEVAKPVEPKPVKQEEQPIEIPAEQPVAAEEQRSVPQFDFTSRTPEDSYSFIREEPETIRHELILDEAETWEDEAEPVVEEITESEKPEEEISTIIEEAEVVPEPEIKEPETIFEPEIAIEPEPEVVQPEPVTAIQEEKTVVEEPVKDEAEVITRNQKISSQLGDKASKSEQLSIKPISDIKLAITLNDKLLYVKDLFNGYNLAYSEAIEILNRFNTFEEAQRFLKTNYVTKNNWEGKQATADKFYALLKRRYA
ncbi:hypothetical protein KXD93_28655 [Mucilaginibacter sp. BJC16-A38]|uniref:hypothetical protein n=1 Tax=Mucilaginibacter phenanthrenivorans TaxID=1234842 RepID=UPI0021584719|nr:hypothetical protein [Mucilaginibacter phenanthrenivorans]MCR8561660.1 hypothetical protein [Mucilaginibacter phenanthrenivorans]